MGEELKLLKILGEHLVHSARNISKKAPWHHRILASILADYVSRGDLLVGGVTGEGKEEGREKEDGREEGGGNAS